MKQCPFCGAQIAGDSRFCSECGKEITQANVCPHCGASVGEGDAFCQNCGKSIKENVVTDPSKKTCPHCGAIMNEGDAFCQNCGKRPTDEVVVADEVVNEEYEEEQPKSGFKKYLPYIIGAVVVLAIIGFFSSKDSKGGGDAQPVAVDTMTVDSVETADETPITKEKLESILSQLVGEIDSDLALKKVNKLFTEKFKNDFNELYEAADKNGMERPRIWWSYSDSDPTNFSVDKIEQLGTNKAKATVKLSSDVYNGHFEVTLNNEAGEWLIEKIFTICIENAQAFEETNDDYEENLDWLQGHWVYEQGSYKGHFIIQGDKITQYSSMNPERETSTFRVEGDEIVSRIGNGVNLTVKIDFANHTIDYGDGNWMHKVE